MSDGPDEEASWALAVCKTAQSVFPHALGIGVQLYEHDDAFSTEWRHSGVGSATRERLDAVKHTASRVGPAVRNSLHYPGASAVMLSSVLRRFPHARWSAEALGLVEMCGIVAHPSPGHVAVMFFELEHAHVLTPHELSLTSAISLFLEAGANSLRFGGISASLSLDGQRLDGEVDALWPALNSGRYRVHPRGSGTARHLVLVENTAFERAHRKLTAEEVQVLELTARGVTGKEQAWEMGLSAGSISRLLDSGSLRLGFANTTDAVRFTSGLLRAPGDVDTSLLTQSETEVLSLVQQGLSNREISLRRGRSTRTVANQVAALLRKTGAAGRRGLFSARPR